MFQSIWTTTRWALMSMAVGSLIVATLLPTWHWDYELFHVLIEGGGALMGFGLALIVAGMIHKERLEANYTWLIACFLSMGTLDMAHSLMPPGQAFVWLHSTATFIGGLFAALIWLPKSTSKRFFNKPAISTIWLLAISFSLWSVLWPEATPAMLDEQMYFTVSAKFFNIVGGLGFLITWLYFAREYHYHHHPESFYFSNQFCLFGIAGLLFETSTLWDGNWWLWHMLRAFAYILLMLHFGGMYWRDITELAKLNHELENRVHKRTNALKTALIDLQQTQSQLIQTEKMASLGRLVAGVAHEVNTPISTTLLSISHLEDSELAFSKSLNSSGITKNALGTLLETIRETAQESKNALGEANQLILSFKQLAVDQTTETRRSFNLQELIKSIFSTLQIDNIDGIRTTITCADDITLDSFPGPLGQVLNNLVENTLLHGFEGQMLGAISIHAIKEGAHVTIQYKDDGVGMAATTVDKIFDPFFTTKTNQGGNGIGMSITFNLVTGILGGTITCQSTPGEGVCFSLCIPLKTVNRGNEDE